MRMTLRFVGVVVMFVAFAAALAGAQASQGEQQLEAARKVEVVDGNYPAAIKQYQAIADKFAKTEPRVAATALLRMADLYQKSGSAQAQVALERVVREFGSQATQVAEARAKLASLNPASASRSGAGIRTGVLCSGAGCLDWVSSVSADGRFATKLEPGGDLQVIDLETQAVERKFALATPPGIGGVQFTLFSPDSRTIAFSWFGDFAWNAPGNSVNPSSAYTLHVVQNETGARPRILLNSRDIRWVNTQSWSNDGSRLLVQVQHRDRTTALAWVSAGDGSMRVIRSQPANLPIGEAALSPDGRFIAFASAETKLTQGPTPIEALEYRLYAMGSDGVGSPQYVATLGSRNDKPFWSPDGTHLLYTGDVPNSVHLFARPMIDGAPAGAAFPVRRGIGSINFLGVTRDGRFYYSQRRDGLQEIVVASIDVTGKLPATPRVINSVSVAGGSWPSWSPDGKHLAFANNQTARGPVPTFAVVIHTLATGQEKVYRFPGPIASSVQWKPDSSEIVFKAALGSGPRPSEYAWYSARPGEELSEIVAPITTTHGVLSKDGTTLFEFRKEGNYGVRHLTAVNIASGNVRTLHTLAESTLVSPPALSPDGQTVAFAFWAEARQTHLLASVRIDGRGYREIAGLPGGGQHFIAWTADGRHLLFTESVRTPLIQQSTTKCRLMRLGSDGGKAEFTGLETEGWCAGFAVSPDGTRIAIPRRGVDTWDFAVLDVSASALSKR